MTPLRSILGLLAGAAAGLLVGVVHGLLWVVPLVVRSEAPWQQLNENIPPNLPAFVSFSLVGTAALIVFRWLVPPRRRPSPQAGLLVAAVAATALGAFMWAAGWAQFHATFGAGWLVADILQLALAAAGTVGAVVWAAAVAEGRRRAGLVLALAGLAIAGASASSTLYWTLGAGAARPGQPNVIVIVVDCLRADHLPTYGYARDTAPNLRRLAEIGRVYRDARSTASWTKPAVGSLLTGWEAADHGGAWAAGNLRPGARTLMERLKESGYFNLYAAGSNSWIGSDFGFTRGADYIIESAPVAAAGRPHDADDLVDHSLGVLREVGARPFFLYLHIMDVHAPYNPAAEPGRFAEGPPPHPALAAGELKGTWVRRQLAAGLLDGADRQYAIDVYDAMIHFVDAQIGRLFATLQRWGRMENTVVLFTSDHGEEFWEHGSFEHGQTVFEEVVRVPLILAGPGIEPGAVTTPVSLIDVAPTVLAATGDFEAASALPGASLLGPVAAGRSLYSVNTLMGPVSVGGYRDGDKVIRRGTEVIFGDRAVGAPVGATAAAYRLAEDPAEQRPVARPWPAPLPGLETAVEEYRDRLTRPAGGTASLEPWVMERVRALGYVQ